LRILLVEDNAVNQEVAEELLKAMRHKVHAVTNGRLAVQAVRESFFDLILMDIQMPEMGGFEATREIRVLEEKTGRRTPIIAMTAHALKEDQQRCLDEGMDGSKGADNNNLNAVAMYECM
jgi:two-component system sensor histidine kinase/response regulator